MKEYIIPGTNFMTCDGKFYVCDADGKFVEIYDDETGEMNE